MIRLISLLFVLPTLIFSQIDGAINGYIYDSKSQLPLLGANVIIEGTDKGAISDENGFFVLVDGDETNHKASSVGEFWTLTIPFSYGSEEIEIIGTFVIPEFGTIAALVLVVAISSILIISAKNKQIFIPRM